MLSRLADADAEELLHDWSIWGRPEQHAPRGDWSTWLVLAGRGFGKTRTGAEWVRWLVESGEVERLALVGATMADVRDTMVEGESGIRWVFPPSRRPRYVPSKRAVEFHNGARALMFSDEEPDRLRGPQHGAAWLDEVAAFKQWERTWSNLLFGLRLGARPRALLTTTPRPLDYLRDLVRRARSGDASVALTVGSTLANAANLPTSFISKVYSDFGGTRLGRQELDGEILGPVDGGLFRPEWMQYQTAVPPLSRVVVGVDPAISERHDETGIVVAGRSGRCAYVLEDLSGTYAPSDWARTCIEAQRRWKAHEIVVERNRGGDMAEALIRTAEESMRAAGEPRAVVREITAFRGKDLRAEPIAALYEQRRVFHRVPFDKLEAQMVAFTASAADEAAARRRARSPDRLDALVHAIGRLGLHLTSIDYRAADIGDERTI